MQIIENVAEEQRGEDLGLPFDEPCGRTGVVLPSATISRHSEGAAEGVRPLDVVVVLMNPTVDDVVHEHIGPEIFPVPIPHRVG